MIKVLIADDHSLIREGFKKIISREVDMEIVGEAKNAGEVLESLAKKECDVVVLDISMPQKSGLDLLKELKQHYGRIAVLILSMHPEDRFAVRALKAGASGYITKERAPEELVNAIRKIREGGKYITNSLAETLATHFVHDRENLPHENLSDREFQVFLSLAQGKSVADISVELSLSHSTINTYRARIFDKMNMKNNSEIIHYAIRNKLID
jgi:two-component system invasion response regulator UvrY